MVKCLRNIQSEMKRVSPIWISETEIEFYFVLFIHMKAI